MKNKNGVPLWKCLLTILVIAIAIGILANYFYGVVCAIMEVVVFLIASFILLVVLRLPDDGRQDADIPKDDGMGDGENEERIM